MFTISNIRSRLNSAAKYRIALLRATIDVNIVVWSGILYRSFASFGWYLDAMWVAIV